MVKNMDWQGVGSIGQVFFMHSFYSTQRLAEALRRFRRAGFADWVLSR